MHGTRSDPKRHHPVVDVDFWRKAFPLKDVKSSSGIWVDGPERFVRMLLRREAALMKIAKAPEGVPVDLFLWGYGYGSPEKPYTTRIGGSPWREEKKAWPKGADGRPMTFIAQICFLDSMDVIDTKLPGDVLLIFGEYVQGEISLGDPRKVLHLEWSSVKVKSPWDRWSCARWCLPFRLDGAIHRMKQYPGHDDLFGGKSLYDAEWQGTIIGKSAYIPQGEESDGLIATLASVLPQSNPWPLLNVPAFAEYVAPKGHRIPIEMWKVNIGDAGVIVLRRNKKGEVWADMLF